MPSSGITIQAIEIDDPRIRHAANVILSTYGDSVSVYEKAKSLIKFGRSLNVQTTKTTIMELPSGVYNETLPSGNTIDTISSSNAGDAQTLRIEGHTVSGSDLTFVVQDKALSGQSKVTLDTPLYRVTRAYNTSTSSAIAGTVYIYEDTAISGGTPTDGTKVHALINTGDVDQTQKCATAISSSDYWIITSVSASLLAKVSNAYVDCHLEQKNHSSSVWLPLGAQFTAEGQALYLDPPLIVPKNSDVRMVGNADTNGRDCEGFINGYLAKVVG